MRFAALVLGGALVLLAAACGGSPTSAAPPASGVAAFSSCMRSHGVPTFPGPAPGGLLPKRTPQQLGVSSAELDAADRACIHFAPNAGKPSAAQVAAYRTTMLRYARCVRSHGVPKMPDPDNRGHLDVGPGSDVDVNSPQFEAAYNACRKDLSP